MTVDVLEALTGFRTWTLADLDDIPDDGRYEIVDGRLVYVPSGGRHHEYATVRLSAALLEAEPPALAVLGATGIGINEFNYRIPDAVVVLRAVMADRDPSALDMADVVLAVEVMSPSSRLNDRVAKPAQYAEAGLRNYWRFEPDDVLLIAYELRDGSYAEVARAVGDSPLTVTKPFAITIVPSSLVP